MKRYEIHWCRLDPVEGSEMAKTRPVVIVSLDVLNEKLNAMTVCPITSRAHPFWRTRLAIPCEGHPAEIAVDQIRSVSKARLGSLIGTLSKSEAALLRAMIAEMYAEA
jgi:mRNA interferase MazF